MSESNEDELDKTSDPNWFRAPSRRERRIAAAFFIGFGLFFIALFVVLSGWWFRWVILVLAGYSIFEGLRHLRGIRSPYHCKSAIQNPKSKINGPRLIRTI